MRSPCARTVKNVAVRLVARRGRSPPQAHAIVVADLARALAGSRRPDASAQPGHVGGDARSRTRRQLNPWARQSYTFTAKPWCPRALPSAARATGSAAAFSKPSNLENLGSSSRRGDVGGCEAKAVMRDYPALLETKLQSGRAPDAAFPRRQWQATRAPPCPAAAAGARCGSARWRSAFKGAARRRVDDSAPAPSARKWGAAGVAASAWRRAACACNGWRGWLKSCCLSASSTRRPRHITPTWSPSRGAPRPGCG